MCVKSKFPNYTILLTFSQIFDQVKDQWAKLDADKLSWAAFVTPIYPGVDKRLISQLPRKLEIVLQKTEAWRLLIENIHDHIMPVYESYRSVISPKPPVIIDLHAASGSTLPASQHIDLNVDPRGLKIKRELLQAPVSFIPASALLHNWASSSMANFEIEKDGFELVHPSLRPKPYNPIPSLTPPPLNHSLLSNQQKESLGVDPQLISPDPEPITLPVSSLPLNPSSQHSAHQSKMHALTQAMDKVSPRLSSSPSPPPLAQQRPQLSGITTSVLSSVSRVSPISGSPLRNPSNTSPTPSLDKTLSAHRTPNTPPHSLENRSSDIKKTNWSPTQSETDDDPVTRLDQMDVDVEDSNPPEAEEANDVDLEGSDPPEAEEANDVDLEGSGPPEAEEANDVDLEGSGPPEAEEANALGSDHDEDPSDKPSKGVFIGVISEI